MKKLFKKAISILLVAVMVFGVAPLACFVGLELPEFNLFTTKAEAAEITTSEYYTYTVSNGKATINSVDESISGNITIPSTLSGYPTTRIGDDAFLYCTSLESVTIPDSVKIIGDGAFVGCYSLRSVKIGNGVTTIGANAFYDCPISSLTIGDSVTTIGENAFNSHCLSFIHIPENVTTIGSYAFGYTDVAYICSCTICYAKEYADENSIDFALCNGHGIIDGIVSGKCGKNLTYILNIKTGDLDIEGTGAMYNYKNISWDGYGSYGNFLGAEYSPYIKNVRIGNGVTSIGDSAFYGCSDFATVTIGNGVTNIGGSAFYNCDSLTDVYYKGDLAGWCEMNISDYYSNPKFYADNLYVDGVLIEGDIIIPDGVSKVGDYVFLDCTEITSVVIPDSVTYIGPMAFNGCASLKSIVIPDSVRGIYYYAFTGCSSLNSVTIPVSVIQLTSDAFGGCASLTDIYYTGTEADWDKIEKDRPLVFTKDVTIHFEKCEIVWDIDGDSDITQIYKVGDKIIAPQEPIKKGYKFCGWTPVVSDTAPSHAMRYTAIFVPYFDNVYNPTQIGISYGDSIVLHVYPSRIPVGGYVEWYASNSNFNYTVSSNGNTCTITPEKSGSTTFTALIYDAEGNIVSADEQTMTSKAGFFDKLIAFFKKLFGLTKTIPEAIKYI